MKFIAEINVMPLRALLDPQGKAVNATLHGNGYPNIDGVRIGKHISLEIEADSREAAARQVEEVCARVLSNPVMEGFDFQLTEPA
ncbi:MAG: phosphoribosylformylglycinamidine synthase subunit PurS [Bacteroidales bacterium]|nr:phosphoribosylformylglycinamidine synthase subunit PurS [Bacteroidales bacterium]